MKMFRAAILTAKEVEFDAVRRQLRDERRSNDTFDGTVYRRARIREHLDGEKALEKWEIAIYRTGRGQQAATYGTQVLLQDFLPDIVLFVGVAGGDPSHHELSVGDVVVGKLVRYYERASQYEDHFQIKDGYHEPNRALVGAAEYEADEAQWLERVVGERKNTKVLVEEIASGEKVQKSSSSALWLAIKERYPDVIAVETEGQGFHYSVAQVAGRGLMIRGISDMLDNKDDDASGHGSDDDRQAIASDHAAAFAINLLINLNTEFLEHGRGEEKMRYAVTLKTSTDSLEGVQRVTRLLADAINDPNLTVESLQPSNSFILRVATTRYSAAFAHALFQGRFLSELVAVPVMSLQSDVEITGEPVFDGFLSALRNRSKEQILAVQNSVLEKYPQWRAQCAVIERIVLRSGEESLINPDTRPQDIVGFDELAARLVRLEREGYLSRKRLAYELGVSSTAIYRWMRGSTPSAISRRRLIEMLPKIEQKYLPPSKSSS